MISNAQAWDNLKFDLEGLAERLNEAFSEHFTIPMLSLHCMRI